MLRINKSLLILGLVLVVCAVLASSSTGRQQQQEQSFLGCFHDWSRCSEWSSSMSGIFWRTCNDRCIKDKGKAGGHCVLVPNSCVFRSRDSTARKCQCFD